MGASLLPTVTDEDLDRHVAELILKEAKKKAEKYGQHGIRAYIASNLYVSYDMVFQTLIDLCLLLPHYRQDSNAPRANKRFLTSIIRSTDDHNKAILKAQAEAAEEIKRARREQEKKERRARAEEAVRARISGSRHKSSRSSHSRPSSSRRSWREEREGEREEGWDRWNGRTADREKERKKRKIRSWETRDEDDAPKDEDEGDRKGKRRTRDKDNDRERERCRSSDRDDRDRRRDRRRHEDGEGRRRRRRRSRSESPRHRKDEGGSRRRSLSPRRASHKKEHKYALDDLLEEESLAEDGEDYYAPSGRSPSNAHEDKSGTGTPSYRTPMNHDERRRSRSSSHSPTPTKRARSNSSSRPSRYSKSKSKPPKSRPSSRSSSRSRSMSLSSSRSSSPSPGPSPAPNLPSKMDKYFEETYDPRLDVTPLSTTPNIPATGLINDAEFEGWDAMLELIKLRRQDKEDRKRLERLGLVDKKDKKGKGKEKVKTGVVESASVINGSGGSILDIEYKKRGTVREWDLGKEGVDLSF